jgi:hypothetical protein
MTNDKKNYEQAIDSFLASMPPPPPEPNPDELPENMDCSSGVCIIKNDKSLIERMNKKIITEDGRQLLI